jgi:signal transduction histidine kinase
VLDGLIASALCVLSVLAIFTADPTPQQPRPADALGVALVALVAGSLVFRRRWPVVVFLVVAGGTVAVFLAGYPDSGLPFVVLIALYTLAARCDRRVTVAATSALLLTIVLVVADASSMDGGTLAGTLAVFTMGAVWGDRKKVRDAYAEQLELRAAEKERKRIEAARRAAAEERLRIARELHDVVAHALSVVAVQSGVGVHVVDSRPDQAKHILETISRVSRDSLDEMRRLLGVLRADPAPADEVACGAVADGVGHPAPRWRPGTERLRDHDPARAVGAAQLAPAPGLRGIDDLVSRVVDAGVPVETEVQGERAAVPAGVDLAAYRIVQEALTNVLKHAGRAQASVVVRYQPGAVHVEVLDDGRGAGSRVAGGYGSGSGHGLVGMRERAALYDGRLEAGPRRGGGYRVAATLRYGSL